MVRPSGLLGLTTIAMSASADICAAAIAPVPAVVAAVRHAAVFATSFTAAGLSAALLRRAAVPRSELRGRERQVLDGLVAGRANKVIAYDLGISPRTVEVYRANVMTQMQARSLSELVRMSILVQRS